MSEFLNSAGLSRLVENIKSKFQKKPYILHLTIDVDNKVIFTEDANEVYHYLMDNKNNPNILFSIDCYETYNCTANSLVYYEDHIEVILEIATALADDGAQNYMSIRFAIFDDSYDWYINDIERAYNNDYLLTGTGVVQKGYKCMINFEERYIGFIEDNGNIANEVSFDDREQIKLIYNRLYSILRNYGTQYLSLEMRDPDYSYENASYNLTYNGEIIDIYFTIIDGTPYGVDNTLVHIKQNNITITNDGYVEVFEHNHGNVDLQQLPIINGLKDTGDGTKFLSDDGGYKEISNKLHCKLWNYGGSWTITIDNNEEYEIVKNGATLYEILKNKLNNLTFDVEFDNAYSLYNVNYNIDTNNDEEILIILTGLKHTTYDEPSTDIFKVGIWLGEGEEGDCIIFEGNDIDITNLGIINSLTNRGNGTKLLADDGKYKEISALHYTGTIKFAYNKEIMNMQGDGAPDLLYFGDTVYGTYIGVFNRDTGAIKYNSGIYKLVMTRDGKDIYVGDCIVEKGVYTTVVIRRVKGSNYYFAKATQYTLYDGEEYYQPGYFDIACIDIEDNTDMYDKHIVEHNPHKNDDVVEICEDGATLSMYPTNQGFCKIVTEYMEGQRKFCPPRTTESQFPTISNHAISVDNIKDINGNYEDVTILSSCIRDEWVEYGILDEYLSNASIHKKVVRIINDESIFKRICICHLQEVKIKDDKFIIETNDNDENVYVLYLKPKQVCEITIIKGSEYNITISPGGEPDYHIYDSVYMFANFVNGIEDIIEFDSNGGTISDYYLWLINYFINSGIDIKVKCVAFVDTATQQILDNKVFTITEIETTNSDEIVLKWRCVGDTQSQCILLINKVTGAYEFSTI